MHVNSGRGAELGKSVGYENGFWFGKASGFISSGVLGSAYVIGGFVSLKTIPAILAITGIGYLLGGSYGATRSSEHCEKKGRELAESGKTEEEIVNACKYESTIQGVLGGGMAGVTIGALPVIMKYSLGSLGYESVTNRDSAAVPSSPLLGDTENGHSSVGDVTDSH